MLDFLRFWLILQIFGLLALPPAWRLFAFLPDRGYAFTKALGLLGAGYILWLGASFGLLRNSAGGALLSMLAFLAVGLWLGRSGLQPDAEGKRPLIEYLRTQRRYILSAEALFLLAMAVLAWFRAYNPDIAGTEKPMEFAFLNGILNTPQFPPRDPWLAGYGISYYYFGYVQLNMLVLLSGVMPAVAFNLGLASIFALMLLGAFGLVYNLVRGDEEKPAGRRWAVAYGLFGALLVGIMGNLEGVLESLHARGLMSEAMHRFFDVKELASAPVTGSWNPGSGHWWWWRASRTLHDYSFSGLANQEVIDEFPIFSFVLGDMHPHVLALPFVLLVIALALNLYRRPAPPVEPEEGAGVKAAWASVLAGFGLDGWGLPLYALALGALGFLNFWDFPIYAFLIVLAYAARRGWQGMRLDRRLWTESLLAFLALVLLGFIFYLPFYLSFSSQASGFLPNLYNPTRFAQYFLMFGPFLVAAAFMLAVAYRRTAVTRPLLARWLLAVLLIPALFLLIVLVGGSIIPGLRATVEQALGASAPDFIPAVIRLRLSTPATWLVVGVLLALIGALASRVWSGAEPKPERQPQRTLLFVLALFFTALLLTYGTEFIFLSDTFGTRMNTVFKFYYQAWVLMALGSAYALYYIRSRGSTTLAVPGQVLLALLVLGGLLYPAFAIPSKANNFQGDPSLDGARFVGIYRPDEAAVIDWLRQNAAPDAVIVEASGGSYSDFNTISAHSGRATLLGWGGHELQWRGNYDEPGRREPLIDTIYQNRDQSAIGAIVNEFGIDYLILGPRELDKYKIPPDRARAFNRLWTPAFEQGGYTLYRWADR